MSATVSFRVEDNIRSLLEALAAKTHLTKTKIINEALAEYLKKTDNKIVSQVKILRMIDNDDDYLSEEV